ncbi:MAG: zinc ABC transporter substrate-binding protein [Bacilli bacterium]|nr:zinc ABC transporter substrate-binding protein [Bacilli bacterium]MBR3049306.1 zinc ABC transporter substrate-binding protein [Bacilli bacterium]
MKKYLLLVIILITCVFMSGCKQDEMDDISIVVTNYPNEYIAKKLYGKHASITSIYPDGVDISNYKVSKKQKEQYSKSDLFIYNGKIEKERNLAFDLLDLNQDLKIIDTAYVLETDYSPEELWLNPASLLMMAQNIRLGLEEYTGSVYLEKDINKAYEKLKIALSELDANYRIAVDNTNNKVILVSNSALKYLEKFGLEVICIDNDVTAKDINKAEELIDNETISYIYKFKGDKLNGTAKQLLENHSNVKTQDLNKLDNLSDSDRTNKRDYITIMNNNLDLLKKELYQ